MTQSTQQTPVFQVDSGGFKLIKVTAITRGVDRQYFTKVRYELYAVNAQGREAFVRYVHSTRWHQRVRCITCGAQAHEPCKALGMVSLLGTVMKTVHAARKRMSEA